eukprot:875819-Alexandrium_andersonii.AAC.1
MSALARVGASQVIRRTFMQLATGVFACLLAAACAYVCSLVGVGQSAAPCTTDAFLCRYC